MTSALTLALASCTLAFRPPPAPCIAARAGQRSTALRLAADAGGWDDDEADADDDEEEYIVEDWDTAWQRFRLEVAVTPAEVQRFLPIGVELLVGSFFAAAAFVLVLRTYLEHTGGIVLVPEGVYNFHELQAMEPAHLMQLGLPSPAPTPRQVVGLHWLQQSLR